MVSCEPYHSYKVPLKNNGQSIIEHNLVTIYLSLEWPNNTNETPNLLIHIFDKKTSPKSCKIEPTVSYIQQNQPSLFVNSINHHHQQQQQQNFGSTYQPQQQQQQQYNHHSSVINNEPPTPTALTSTDHNDVSSTTTTVVFNGIQPTQLPSIPHTPIQQIKTEVQTQLSPVYRRQQTPNSPSTCSSSSNQQYLSSQHVIQTPSSNIDTQSNLQMSPTSKTISPTSSTTIPTKQTMTHVIDLQQQNAGLSTYPLSQTSTYKAVTCCCIKPSLAHDSNCPALNMLKQQSNGNLNSQTIVCRPPINRSIAQRAAVASQIRAKMTPTKDSGQTPASTFLQFSISNAKTPETPSNIATIVSQQSPNFPTIKKPIARQRSIGSANSRPKKKRITKQISLPNGTNQDQTSFFNQFSLNDSKQDQSSFTIKEEHITSSNPTIKLVSPFSIQTTVTNTEIDQTIDDVINGKGDIRIDDLLPIQTKRQQQPSSQLVWVQNGTVTTKTWLSPLYQKQQQQQQQSTYDTIGSALTHQDVVNIAQQVVFPTATEQTQIHTGLQSSISNNSKKRNRLKSVPTNSPKRNRNRKNLLNQTNSTTTTTTVSPQNETNEKPAINSPITPTLNLINKPITWSNIPPSSSSSSLGTVTTTITTNTSILHSNQDLLSFDKNDSWQTPCIENVDAILDEFQLVSIDEQRINSHHNFDFDLSTDGFPSKTTDQFCSSTPPPPLTMDNQRYSLSSTDKLLNSTLNNSRLVSGDVDVYEHFLNPNSSTIWQENQVTSSVSTPPDFHMNNFSMQNPNQHMQQQYYSSQTAEQHFDSSNLQSQATK